MEFRLLEQEKNDLQEKDERQNNKQNRLLEVIEEGMSSLPLELKTIVSMDESVYRQILPGLDYSGAMSVGYSLNNP